MNRFLSLIWNEEDAEASSVARFYVRRHPNCVVQVWGGWNAASLFDEGSSHGHGVVIGRAQHAGTVTVATKEALTQWCATVPTDRVAERFARDFWGEHIALFGSADGVVVYRDASGAVPCMLLRRGGLSVVTSRLSDAAPFLDGPAEVKWESVALFCASPLARGVEHAIAGVSQLRPGWSVRIAYRGFNFSRSWRPEELAANETIYSADEAGAALREALVRSVRSSARGKSRVALLLSGGVDSSIVAACLSEVGPAKGVICFNMTSTPGVGDERAYARAVCERFGFALEEAVPDQSVSHFEKMLVPALTSHPVATLSNAAQAQFRAYADLHGADVLMSGHGGDATLGNLPLAVVAADWLWSRRARTGTFLGACMHAAQLSGKAAWEAAGASLLAELVRRTIGEWPSQEEPRESLFLTREVSRVVRRAGARRSVAPKTRKLPAGKVAHLEATIALAQGSEYPLAIGRSTERTPLLSQPAMEASFRIPMSVLTLNGWERGLARRAFSELLPTRIAMRRTKGDPTGGISGLIQAHSAWLLDYLWDGVLARQKLIDLDFLRQSLKPDFAFKAHDGRFENGLLLLISAEHWARQWESYNTDLKRLAQS